MSNRYKNPKHNGWIHEQPCILARFSPCNGSPTQGHHLMRPWHGKRGASRKSNDRNLVPMCAIHHRALHDRGDEDAFFLETAKNDGWGRYSAQFLWLTSPHYKAENV